jgi:hypothetical protein
VTPFHVAFGISVILYEKMDVYLRLIVGETKTGSTT